MGQILFLLLGTILSISSPAKGQGVVGLDAIYGVDDRELISQCSSRKIKKLAQSVAMIAPNEHFKEADHLLSAGPLSEDLQICSEERFSRELSLGGCTGFLVGKDLLATAGHCFLFEDDCLNRKIVFGITEKRSGPEGYKIKPKDVFSCKKIVVQRYDGDEDYALIQLDRATSRRPLKVNLTKKLADDAEVFMIGHPLGMPLTLSKKVKITENQREKRFGMRLDSFAGNSGSPLFNAETFEVEGILVAGGEDFVRDEERACNRYQTFKEDGTEGGEEAVRMSELAPFIPKDEHGKSWFWQLSHKYKIF